MEVGKALDNSIMLQNDEVITSAQVNSSRQIERDQDMIDAARLDAEEEEETQPNVNGFFADMKSTAACSVRVALRVRPLIGRELYESPNICITCIPEESQLIIGKDRMFTFDKVFDLSTRQRDIFEGCVKNLVLGCFKGYNATVLAYGQTGSGKTHTMGSGYTIGLKDEDLGIIPRVIKLIFEEVDKRKHKAEFIIKCTFLEIYNEELHDLLDHGSFNPGQGAGGGQVVIDRFIQKKEITIREEKNGNISVFGLREEKVNCYEELAACLDRGSNFRSTASTLMNNCSSRSHAIFTISIEQHVIDDLYKANDGQISVVAPTTGEPQAASDEFMVAKFHFVDLAGSERAKRTGATGATLKEGISINKGLLSLGNVISALTEEKTKGHVPYRDSKLTRILQDSLGGNSRTIMIACVSPAEINFEETLNTLKYASRARNIKNKPVVNRDPNSQQIAQLRQQVYELSRELLGFKKLLISNNIEFESNVAIPTDLVPNGEYANSGGNEASGGNKDFMLSGKEIQKLETEIKDLKVEKSKAEKKWQQAQSSADTYKEQLSQLQLEYFQVQKDRDMSRFQLEQITQVLKERGTLQEIVNQIHGYSNTSAQGDNTMDIDHETNTQQYDYLFGSSGPCILEEYQVKVEEQKKELGEKDALIKSLQKDYELLFVQSQQDTFALESKESEIERLKRSVNKLQKENVQIRSDARKGSKLGPGAIPSQQFAAPINPVLTAQRRNTQTDRRQPNVMPGPLKKKAAPRASNTDVNQWLPDELDYNIKHFNELFINNLSQSLSNMLIIKKGSGNSQLKGSIRSSGAEHEEAKEDDQLTRVKELTAQDQLEPHRDRDEDDEVEHSSSSEGGTDSENVSENEGENPRPLAHVEQEVIESHEETKKLNDQMQEELVHQELQIETLDVNLKDKESLLDAIKESHKMMQNSLLEAMKMEYHKKIQSLDGELKSLEKERGESLRKADSAQQKSKLDESYKKKMKELEDKLRDLKTKDRDQNNMLKEANKVKQRIKALESEIDKMRTQKVSLMKKIKEESENHRKWKADRAKELLQVKQSNMKKDREIVKLKRDNKQKEMLAKRKQEEISALLKRQKIDKQKQINGEKDRNQKKNVDIEKIQEWIVTNTDKMLHYKELQQALAQEQQAVKEVETQISEEQNQYAVLSVKKSKTEFKKTQIDLDDEESLYYVNEEIEQLDIEMKAIQENIESLEEKLDFINLKISNINIEVIGLNPDDVEQLRFDQLQSIEGARACLVAFFGILLDVNVTKKQLQNQALAQDATIDSLMAQIENLTMVQQANEINFQNEIEQINKDYKYKEDLLLKVIMENSGIDMEAVMSGDAQGRHDIFKEYLKNKENEILLADGVAQESQSNMLQGSNQFLKKAGTLKLDNQRKNKELMYNQSKMALSKRVAELERKNRDEEKKLETIRHKFEQSNQEKELYKRQLEVVKQKLKIQEVQEVKMQKAMSTEDATLQLNMGLLQKSPRGHFQQQQQQQQQQTALNQQAKLLTLQEVRKERKIKKLGTTVTTNGATHQQQLSSGTNQQSAKQLNTVGEPKVIADEPMQDEPNHHSNGQSQPDVHKKNQLRIVTQTSESNGNPFGQAKNSTGGGEMEQINVFARLSQAHKGKAPQMTSNSLNTSQSQITPQQQPTAVESSSANPGFADDNKWRCIISKDSAHNGQICALASVGNQLYSTSNKSLKIWDLDTMTCVSDIQAHTGFIKCITIWEDKKLLLTASDKVIMLWDMISLTNVGTLKGHKDEIKAMNITQDDHYLFSAGKGSQNGGALLIWDLRKGVQPSEEREKNQDIFSLASTGDYLFYGCRNHLVFPFNIKTQETLAAFEPPHFDAVTSLKIIGDTLISGSRDKNLRCWDYNNLQTKYSDVMQAHSDWVNSLETDCDRTELYSGGKDGVVKVWKIKNKKLKCQAALSSNAGSVNSLCKIDKQFGKMFAQGCADKSIRMWKYKDKNGNQQEDGNSPDQDMEDYEARATGDNEVFNHPETGADMHQDYDDQIDQDQQNYYLQQYEKEEAKYQTQDNSKYQPIRQSQSAQGYASSSAAGNSNATNKLQQMRRQKRMQENQKRQSKENQQTEPYQQ